MTIFTHDVAEDQCDMRVDALLAQTVQDLSRARIQTLIKQGYVLKNGALLKTASYRVQTDDHLQVTLPPPDTAEPEAQNIPLDIVFEDDHVIVINKPAGLVVHPGAGNADGTLVNALLYHCKSSLSGIGGVMRPGIVHRLDKETSGLMIAAKNDSAHHHLSEQLQTRTLTRIYHALVLGSPMPPAGKATFALGRDRNNRLKMGIKPKGGKDAVTHYKVLETYKGCLSLVQCKLETGRTHQIRVHMQALKYPIIGDPLYGPQDNAVTSRMKGADYDNDTITAALSLTRQMLHARTLSFEHPDTDETMTFSADYPEDFLKIIGDLG